MKQTTVTVLLGLFFVIALAGCGHHGRGVKGSGNRKTESREVSSFKAIDSEGAFDFEITCQKSLSVSLEGDDNILPIIQTDVRDGVLYLRTTSAYNSKSGVAVRISLPNLESIKAAGAGKFQVSNIQNEKFRVDTNGATSLSASGETRSVEIHNAGAGKIDTNELHALKAKVEIAGAASVDVNATEQLDANVSGVGHVSYSGHPKTVNKNISGLGVVSAKD